MGNNHKNAMIAMLLGVLVIMAVAYAAFSTALTINGTATINSSWNVQYDTSKTSGAGVISTTTGAGGTTAPSGGTIAYPTNQSATLSATLNQPGDKVEYTLTILNTGSLDATLGTPTMTATTGGSCTGSGTSTVCTSDAGHIEFTIGSFTPSASLAATNGSSNIKVTAKFKDTEVTSLASSESITVNVSFTASQA